MKLLLIFLATIVCKSSLSTGARILLIPPQIYSHIQTMTVIGEVLIQKGHKVDLLIHKNAKDEIPKQALKAGINLVEFGGSKMLPVFEKGYNDKLIAQFLQPGQQSLINTIKIMNKILPDLNQITEEALKDDVLEKIRNEKYDFMLLNGMGFTRPIMLIAEILNIPFASVSSDLPTDMLPILFRIPSIDPAGIGSDYAGSELNFFQRLMNCAAYYLSTFLGATFDATPYLKNTTCKDLRCVASKASIWIVDKSPMVTLPLPRGPNMFYVAGLATSDPKPLSNELKQYADSANGGLVVVSFGSGCRNIPDSKIADILTAFGNMPKLKFIMRHEKKLDSEPPKNVKLIPWLPQNDLLGHQNTVLFITHGGNSGIHEGLRNGVPMLGLPITGDQPINVKKMEVHGYGKAFSFIDLTPARLLDTITDVLGNEDIKANVKRASEITKSYPLPREQAADLIDHVIKYGADHLRSVSSNMYWFQVLMWDIALFFLGMLILLGLIIYYVFSKCCRKSKKIKTQ